VYGHQEGYRKIREAGFEAIDWGMDYWNFKAICEAEELKDLCLWEKPLPALLEHLGPELEAIRAAGLTITQAHAPFPASCSTRPEVLDYTIGIYKNLIHLCEAVGCPRLVIHSICLQKNDPVEWDRAYVDDLNRKLYESLIPDLLETSVTVCLENLFSGAGHRVFREGFGSDPTHVAAFIDELNEKAGKTCFGFCLDTGHVNLLRRDFRTFMPILGKRICALHIHDNDQTTDQHLAPYAGNIIWPDFLQGLKAIGYEGDLSFETFAQVSPDRSPVALMPSYMRLLVDIGNYFISQIQGE
jgi:sugar phosphate isomerase/epimerase